MEKARVSDSSMARKLILNTIIGTDSTSFRNAIGFPGPTRDDGDDNAVDTNLNGYMNLIVIPVIKRLFHSGAINRESPLTLDEASNQLMNNIVSFSKSTDSRTLGRGILNQNIIDIQMARIQSVKK